MSFGRGLLTLVVALAVAPTAAQAATYTVSPSGADTNAGSSYAPFKTIGRAAQAAQAGDTVNVTPGVYAETVSLTAANSGATFRGVGPTRPVIEGGNTRAVGFDNNGADGITIENFESAAIPLSQFNHRAHVTVAYLYIRRHGLEGALELMRAGIHAYNAAHKVPVSPTAGYHETVTVAWMRLKSSSPRRRPWPRAGWPSPGRPPGCPARRSPTWPSRRSWVLHRTV